MVDNFTFQIWYLYDISLNPLSSFQVEIQPSKREKIAEQKARRRAEETERRRNMVESRRHIWEQSRWRAEEVTGCMSYYFSIHEIGILFKKRRFWQIWFREWCALNMTLFKYLIGVLWHQLLQEWHEWAEARNWQQYEALKQKQSAEYEERVKLEKDHCKKVLDDPCLVTIY